jgi:thiamine biosynthesis protein ThiS
MKIKVKIQRTNESKIVNINTGSTVKDILEKLSINFTTVLVTKNKEVITEETKLKDKDSLELLSVISGG